MKKNDNSRLLIRVFPVLLFLFFILKGGEAQKIIFPHPFAFAIDDLGWNIGNNSGASEQGPYRIGLKRRMELSDYQCIVDVAKKSGVRLQALFVIGEMDRENVLATVPSTNVHGAKWDNSANVNDEQIKIMEFVKKNAAWLEFGLHGVGHEFWPDGAGKRNRAEWYSTDDNKPWPETVVQAHIDVFKKIMAQYGIDKAHGHSFPESFVPCAYGYYWNPNGDYSTGTKLGAEGLKYVNTLFTYIEELNPPQGENGGGFDHNVLVVNRINYGNPWYQLASLPTVPLQEQKSDIIETHWTNWLVQDDFLQADLNQRWVDYFKEVTKAENRFVAKNTEQFYSQWLYNKYTTVTETSPGKVRIDNTQMPEVAYKSKLLKNLILKVKLNPGEHISNIELDDSKLGVYYEEGGYGMIVVPKLKAIEHQLTYEVSTRKMPTYVQSTGTYNIYSFNNYKRKANLRLRMYGTQQIDIFGIEKPLKMKSSNPNLKILKTNYDDKLGILHLTLEAHDIQGETGVLRWEY